jgi:hypothetical protein
MAFACQRAIKQTPLFRSFVRERRDDHHDLNDLKGSDESIVPYLSIYLLYTYICMLVLSCFASAQLRNDHCRRDIRY